MLMEPRGRLREEFGVEVPDSTKIRVWDASELRYWVLPRRPERTEGISEAELAELVTWDSMIGVALPRRAAGPETLDASFSAARVLH